MGCFVALIALISPRLALVLLWLFGDLLSRAYDSWAVPLIGFFILPWTTLTYAAFWDWGSGRHVTGIEWFFVAFAFVVDIGSYTQGRRLQNWIAPHGRGHEWSEMSLAKSAHTSRPWRIHELTRDFRLEDVWALDAGRPGRLPAARRAIAAGDPARTRRRRPRAVGHPHEARRPARLGRRGLGTRQAGPDRFAAGCRRTCAPTPPGPDSPRLPFKSLYLLDDELATEIANRTVHGVMHVGWVPDGNGGYHGQLAILVRPNGALGKAYMAAIKPFRHLIVYPPMIRGIERSWRGARREPLRGERQGAPTGDGRWFVLYDADCGLCKWLLAGLLRWDRRERLRPLPLDDPEAARLLERPRAGRAHGFLAPRRAQRRPALSGRRAGSAAGGAARRRGCPRQLLGGFRR